MEAPPLIPYFDSVFIHKVIFSFCLEVQIKCLLDDIHRLKILENITSGAKHKREVTSTKIRSKKEEIQACITNNQP